MFSTHPLSPLVVKKVANLGEGWVAMDCEKTPVPEQPVFYPVLPIEFLDWLLVCSGRIGRASRHFYNKNKNI